MPDMRELGREMIKRIMIIFIIRIIMIIFIIRIIKIMPSRNLIEAH